MSFVEAEGGSPDGQLLSAGNGVYQEVGLSGWYSQTSKK